jgi:fatty-acyl-CoA synthase
VPHEDLSAAISRAARDLTAAGVSSGDAVGIWLPNRLEYLAVEFAAASLGASVVGINTRYGDFELAHVLAAGRLKAIATVGRFLDLDLPQRLRAAFAAAQALTTDLAAPSVLVCSADGARMDDFDLGGGVKALSPSGPVPTLIDEGDVDGLVNYFATSGSTGAPKLAGHKHSSITTHAPLAAEAFGMRPGDVVLGVLPFCGVFGFNVAMCSLASGATLLIEPAFDASAVLSAIARFGVTHVFGGDDLWGRLQEAWQKEPMELPRLRRGAIAEFQGRAVELGAWARDHFGAELTGLYGASELLSFMLTRPAGGDIAGQVKGGGRVLSDEISLRLADPETGVVVAGAEQGELQVRGFNVLHHYLGNREATQRAFTDDGWFRTGDLCRSDGVGGLTFICRNSAALRLRGFLVEPAEIERFLMSLPGVELARVVGVKTDRGDLAVGFVTVSDISLTGESLLGACKGRLAGYKIPSQIVVLDTLPVTAGTNGEKVRLEELKRLARELAIGPGAEPLGAA